jgi:hypothetical protein
MSFHPGDYCVNCDKLAEYHIDGKCPFEASTFVKREGFFTFEEKGVGIANIGAIQKIQFFDISVVNSPDVPLVEEDPNERHHSGTDQEAPVQKLSEDGGPPLP